MGGSISQRCFRTKGSLVLLSLLMLSSFLPLLLLFLVLYPYLLSLFVCRSTCMNWVFDHNQVLLLSSLCFISVIHFLLLQSFTLLDLFALPEKNKFPGKALTGKVQLSLFLFFPFFVVLVRCFLFPLLHGKLECISQFL